MALAAVLATGGRAAAAGPVTHYVINPSPIAATASLSASATVAVTVTAEDSTGTGVAGATVYLSFTPTTGGGSAVAGTTTLGIVPVAFTTNAAGQIAITYQTPAVLPTGGKDLITAKSAKASASIVSLDAYQYSKVTAYTYSAIPLAAPGSLTASQAVSETLTARTGRTPVPGATVYLSLAAAIGDGTATVGTTALTSTPQPFTASTTGQIIITYTAPATLPTTGTDVLTAADATKGVSVSKQVAYSYGAPAAYVFAPSPIAATGTLAGHATVTVRLTVRDASGNPVAGAKVYLSFVPTTGGGTAKVGAKALTTTSIAYLTDPTGQVGITYVTPTSVPATGADVITAQNAATGATITATDSYTF
jgi:hypothetical protein